MENPVRWQGSGQVSDHYPKRNPSKTKIQADTRGTRAVEESIFEHLGYIIVILFMVLPRLIKWLAKVKPTAKQPKEDVKPTEGPVILLKKIIESITDEDEKEPEITPSKLDELALSIKPLLTRTDELMRLFETHGGATAKMSDTVDSSCIAPLKAIAEYLNDRINSGDLPTLEEEQRILSNLKRIEQLITTLESMTAKRIHPESAEILGLLDIGVQECLVPYLTHARHMNLNYPTQLAMAVFGEPGDDLAHLFERASIAPTVVHEKQKMLPRTWVHLPSDVYLDVFHSTRGLASTLSSELGVMPAPLSLDHYTDERSFIAGLIGGWLPRLFGDTCAALLLGPGFAAGLAKWLGTDVTQTEAVTAIIGRKSSSVHTPLHIRMFVACRVLQYLGLDDQGHRRWREWTERVGDPKAFIVKGLDERAGSLPVAHLLGSVSRVVDYLISEPLAPLGGYTLPNIPSLRCNEAFYDKMQEVAQHFTNGVPVDASGSLVLGASQLAAEKSNTFEQRITRAALHSLAGDGGSITGHAKKSEAHGSLLAHVQSRELIARAVVTGAAIAPRTSRHRAKLSLFEKT
ncbi:MAG: hypothetical protein GY847_00630 [Proteobacteria bacterium]|nr:hypothetical protein [Pseudomonadota bacterium]